MRCYLSLAKGPRRGRATTENRERNRSAAARISRIELSHNWQRTDREYTGTLVLRVASERRRKREAAGARVRGADDGRGGRPRGQTLCLQAAPSVTWPCFDRELGPLRGEDPRLCCPALRARRVPARCFGVPSGGAAAGRFACTMSPLKYHRSDRWILDKLSAVRGPPVLLFIDPPPMVLPSWLLPGLATASDISRLPPGIERSRRDRSVRLYFRRAAGARIRTGWFPLGERD